MARSRAAILASFLMDRVARAAARSRAPTSSTPGSPCSTWRSAASEAAPPGRATAAMAPASTSLCVPALWVTASTLTLATLPAGGRAAQAGGPGGGEAGLDDGTDQLQALVEGGERALHGVGRQPLDVAPAVPEGLPQGVELRGQADPPHTAVV